MTRSRPASLLCLAKALLLWMTFGLISSAATAQTVIARSGEHDGFTRIVLEYGSTVNWTVGRMPDGYALRLNEGVPIYDLTGVFNRIGKSRLGAIWADPETGDLVFSANCPCHAIAFEFRPGTIVIDLKDGPPPKGSGFETALDRNGETISEPIQTELAELAPEFDWTRPEMVLGDLSKEPPAPAPMPTTDAVDIGMTEQTATALVEFEENLRAELAGAASSGLVDLAPPEETGQPTPQTADGVLDQFRIGRTGAAGLGQDTSRQADIGADGDRCASSESLDFASWGDSEKAISDQIADMRNGLVGEFDKVDPDKLKGAIRFHLFLGFGAEVQELMAAFQPSDPDAALWAALARLLEGEPETAGVFEPMLACQGPAALWAMLASDENPDAGFDRQPVLLAFSALPVHLRRHLGPRLVNRFLENGDDEGARILSDAIFRPGSTDAPGIDLMKAQISLEKGDATGSETILRERIALGGPDQAQAYFALVELLVAQRKPLTKEEALAIFSLSNEVADADQGQRLLALAQAASGDFAAAFDQDIGQSEVSSDLWGLLAVLGTDSDLLVHAVLDPDAPPVDALPEEAIRIAERLLELGLAKESQRWQAWAETTKANAAPTLLAARTDLALGLTSEALVRLTAATEQDETARELTIRAFGAAGDDAGQAAALDPSDPRKAAALGRAGDWQALAQSADGPWAALAKDLASPAETDTANEPTASPIEVGPLAKSEKLVKVSAESRDRIESLLTSTAKPQG